MEDQIANKIKRLELENFTCFSKAAFDFSQGINVLIGENGTGKTHVLKVLYAANSPQSPHPSPTYLSDIFMAHPLSQLIRTNAKEADILVEFRNGKYHEIQLKNEIDHLSSGEANFHKIVSSGLFLPVMEMLSWFPGFSSLYNRREIAFDKTYFDLSDALGLPLLKNSALKEAREIISEIEEGLAIEVSKKEGRFYIHFKKTGGEHEATISATGINKIAQLIYLIMNGSLTKDTILFWDEPEANLNPKYITLVAKFLQTLANAGCQIFVASHDYLLVHELSLLSEYREEKELNGETVPDIKFFALYKGEDGSTHVEEGQSMSEIQNDAIGEEYAAHHSREEALWRKPYEKTSL